MAEAKPDPMTEIWARIEWLTQEVGALKRAPKPARIDVTSPYLNSEEAAAYLRMNVNALYSLVERRRLRPLPGYRKYRFTREMLDAYLRGA